MKEITISETIRGVDTSARTIDVILVKDYKEASETVRKLISKKVNSYIKKSFDMKASYGEQKIEIDTSNNYIAKLTVGRTTWVYNINV